MLPPVHFSLRLAVRDSCDSTMSAMSQARVTTLLLPTREVICDPG